MKFYSIFLKFSEEYEFENVVCKILAIVYRVQCVEHNCFCHDTKSCIFHCHYTPAQRSWRGVYWNHLVRSSVCSSVGPSVCRRHGFRSISQVCCGISISNFIYMLMVVIGRSLLIFKSCFHCDMASNWNSTTVNMKNVSVQINLSVKVINYLPSLFQ